MRNIIVIFFILFCLNISCITETSKPNMLDIHRLLIAYGYDDGIFFGSKDIATFEDHLTNDFLLMRERFDFNESEFKLIETELPYTKEGLLRLCSQYLLRTASFPQEKEVNINAIKGIIEFVKNERKFTRKSDTISKVYHLQPIFTSIDEVYDYYNQAIENKINEISITLLDNKQSEQARQLLLNYCINPSEANEVLILTFSEELLLENMEKKTAFLKFVNEISMDLCKKLFNFCNS